MMTLTRKNTQTICSPVNIINIFLNEKHVEVLLESEEYGRLITWMNLEHLHILLKYEKWYVVQPRKNDKLYLSNGENYFHKIITNTCGKGKNVVIDHKNRNSLDNRSENLRVTNGRGNQLNRRNNRVHPCVVKKPNGKYCVAPMFAGKITPLGTYESEHLASWIYQALLVGMGMAPTINVLIPQDYAYDQITKALRVKRSRIAQLLLTALLLYIESRDALRFQVAIGQIKEYAEKMNKK